MMNLVLRSRVNDSASDPLVKPKHVKYIPQFHQKPETNESLEN